MPALEQSLLTYAPMCLTEQELGYMRMQELLWLVRSKIVERAVTRESVNKPTVLLLIWPDHPNAR